MRHATLLKALNLPVMASLVICATVVVLNPLRKVAGQARSDANTPIETVTQSAIETSVPPIEAVAESTVVSVVPDIVATSVEAETVAEVQLETTETLESVDPSQATQEAVTVPSDWTSESPVSEELSGEMLQSIRSEYSSKVPQVTGQTASALAQTAGILANLWHTSSVQNPAEAESPLGVTPPQTSTAGHQTQSVAHQPNELPTAVRIANPETNQYPVAFLVDDAVRSLSTGEVAEYSAQSVTVRFDRGNGQGAVTQELEPGDYRFSVTKDGWVLQRQPATR